jgi:Family of unknown function (DUF5343)
VPLSFFSMVLNVLTPEGVPTPRYHEYRSRCRVGAFMAEALREAYRDTFILSDTDADRACAPLRSVAG